MNRSLSLYRPVLVAGLGCLISLLIFAGGTNTPPPAEGPTFRVMTYNIHHAEGLDGKVDVPRIADLIKREVADIVALQEVDKGTRRIGGRDLGAELAALTGLTCVFSNNYSFDGGEYGNAVLTRFPVRHATNTHYRMINEREQRGLLQLVLDVHGRDLAFLATHLDFPRSDVSRWSNVGEIENLVKPHQGRPLILCGDFNDLPTNRVYRRLSETFDDTWARVGQGEGWTIPANRPNRRIDYVWISRNQLLTPLKAWVPVSEASDHRPVVAEFRLAEPAPRHQRDRADGL